MVPQQRPGKSYQDYGTPQDLLEAIYATFWFDAFTVDLAASEENAICSAYYDKAIDSLTIPWGDALRKPGSWGWLNPPYGQIPRWIKKTHHEAELSGAHIMVLVPASTGSNWWRDHVHNHARVMLLNGRVVFKGHTSPYPKDCALLMYGSTITPGYEVWSWRAIKKAVEHGQ